MSYHEQCYCPVGDTQEWLDEMKCPASIRQIDSDLAIFSDIDFKSVAEEFIERFGRNPRSMALANYVVKDNKVSGLKLTHMALLYFSVCGPLMHGV